jgi:pyridoxamine 5'-phosphate oxidase
MRPVDPIQRFSLWFRTALKRSPGMWFDASSMTLATSSKDGYVTARIVLLKRYGPEGFTFFTNYDSRKGQQLSENARAALVFYWPYLRRQVRVEGIVQRVSREESEEYFWSRPRLSQLAAAASEQSKEIPSRAVVMKRFKELRTRFAGRAVPLPETWGGFRLVPDAIEFWQHRENRLHDRIRYQKSANGKWMVQQLAP